MNAPATAASVTDSGFSQRHACFDVFFTSDSEEGALATILALGNSQMTPMSNSNASFSQSATCAPEHRCPLAISLAPGLCFYACLQAQRFATATTISLLVTWFVSRGTTLAQNALKRPGRRQFSRLTAVIF